MTAETRALFAKAADLLERDGWCQGTLMDADGKRCGAGALIGSTNGNDYWDAVNEIRRAVGTHRVSTWNDAPERTADEVIALFRKLAAE